MSPLLFQTILPILVAVLVLTYLRHGASKKALAMDGVYYLRMHLAYGVIGFLGVTIGISILIISFFAEKYSGLLFISAGIVFVLFISAGLPCFLYYKNHSIKFDSDGVEVKSVFGHILKCHWSDMTSISFNPLSGLITITGKNGQKIKIHQHLKGLISFIKLLESKTKLGTQEIRSLVKST